MQKFNGWYIPDYDTHYTEYLTSKGFEYQKEPRDHAFTQTKKFRTALDIGGNIGFWSKNMCERFKTVEIFEPDASNVECLRSNLEGHNNYNLHQIGLGNKNTQKQFYKSHVSSGAHTFNPAHIPAGGITKSVLEIKTLDSFNLTDVDFIKIDTQGSELEILEGAKQTLTENKCVLNVEIEQKNPEQVKAGRPIFELMESLGYIKLVRFKRDEVLFAKRKR
tara:strand:- start:164 stop:823 length:660 start_codon:yes stop_codon:yes gene_type:complete